jgi:hypothetical protein
VTPKSPQGWPPGVDPIDVRDLGRLGINQDDQLFWDGRRIEIRKTISLTKFQTFITTLAAIFAVLGALGGFVTGFNNASIFLCARDIHVLTCPKR